MIVGIDASNIRAGGGVTHLSECLGAFSPEAMEINKVVLWGGVETMARMPERKWLEKRLPDLLQRDSIARVWWRQTELTPNVDRCADILLVPGGNYIGGFRPFVALAQNLLPFDSIEQRREGWSAKRLRLLLLARLQGTTFKRADGVIYMSAISKDQIERRIGFRVPRSRVVHHGTSPRFFPSLRREPYLGAFTPARPLRLLYVSIIEPYKHQGRVVAAVAAARASGMAVTLDLVGPASAEDELGLRRMLADRPELGGAVRYHGPMEYSRLRETYAAADAFVFASSCETFGIILLEAMAGGLPLLCSHRSSLPEVAGDAALYFDPLAPEALLHVIRDIYSDPALRFSLSHRGSLRAAQFSWERCARETFSFVHEVWQQSRVGRHA